jgi:hypothetical protein
MAPPPPLYKRARALLATMHGKERVIAPLAARVLGLSVDVAPGLDTDAFGKFSRDVARAGSPAARSSCLTISSAAWSGTTTHATFRPSKGLVT